MNDNNETTASKVDGCPYAAALQQHTAPAHSEVQSDQQKEDWLIATRQHCPAFANGKGCPFKGAANANQVQETLLQIPSSHYEMSTFMSVLQGLHGTPPNDANTNYQLPGGCPVPPSIKSSIQQRGGFRHVLEEMSLPAIMARMAQEFAEHNHHHEFKDENSLEFHLAEGASAVFEVSSASEPSTKVEPSTQTPCLSQSLKTGTAVAHEAAENVHFVKNFIQGQIDRHLYRHMVLSLYHVYDALEEALDVHAPRQFAACHFPEELSRTSALAEDVEYWHGHAVQKLQSSNTHSPATIDYIRRIQDIAQREPLLLLAHSYTRYLGDLSGGKILARVARRALDLERNPTGGPVEGLAFYHFDRIASAKLFKDQYRQALDDLPLTPTQIQRLVHEANVAFLLNMRLFEELDVAAGVPGAAVRPLEQVLRMGPEYNHHQDHSVTSVHAPSHAKSGGGGADACPFLREKKASVATGDDVAVAPKGRCPWPFVVFHDPAQFARDWETWVLLGVSLCLLWAHYCHKS